MGRVPAVPRLCELYPGICLTTEEKARKNLSQGSRRVAAGTMKTVVFIIRETISKCIFCTECFGRMRWEGHVARMGEGRGLHTVLVGKPEGKRPLGRPRRRWEDNIQMDLQEVGGGGDWMELAQDRDR